MPQPGFMAPSTASRKRPRNDTDGDDALRADPRLDAFPDAAGAETSWPARDGQPPRSEANIAPLWACEPPAWRVQQPQQQHQHQRDATVDHGLAESHAQQVQRPVENAVRPPLPLPSASARLPPASRSSASDGWPPWTVPPWQGGVTPTGGAGVAASAGVSDGPADLLSPAHPTSNGRSSTADGVVGSHARPTTSAASVAASAMALSDGLGHGGRDEIPVARAASFFRTYFTVVHPQYPFLDMQLCSEYYVAWKQSLSNGRLGGWPAFFVKMIFALGSLIESKNDSSPYLKHQNLKSTAQAEQSIVTDSTSTPLVRLQAMLLSAMFALHAENTWRIVHISGVIMKFATVHRFHRLPPDAAADPAGQMAVRVWSSAYVLDRAVSSALGSPVSLPDLYISSRLYEATAEPQSPVPWLADCSDARSGSLGPGDSDLRTFAHICRIRAVQSYFMHVVERDDLRDGIPPALEAHMLQTLREWEDSGVIARHSILNSDGYRSPMWLQHIGHLTRLSICFVNRANIHTAVADNALAAGCAACRTFRALQKKREIAQPWLVVLSQFRAAVTLWYIVWARAVPVPRDVGDSLRDCSAVLAIFAERWPKAEPYRDCFELLSTSVPRCRPLGRLPADARAALRTLTRMLDESGMHWVTLRMLREMCEEGEEAVEGEG